MIRRGAYATRSLITHVIQLTYSWTRAAHVWLGACSVLLCFFSLGSAWRGAAQRPGAWPDWTRDRTAVPCARAAPTTVRAGRARRRLPQTRGRAAVPAWYPVSPPARPRPRRPREERSRTAGAERHARMCRPARRRSAPCSLYGSTMPASVCSSGKELNRN